MTDTTALSAEIEQFANQLEAVRSAVGQVMVGQQGVIEAVLTAIVGGGNVLLEGVPGLGKTELVKALAKTLALDHKRIQFTPDLMPADVVGTTVMEPREGGGYAFEFREGPVFTQLLLADEINRVTPKTQSSLLETMQEGTVTVGGETRRLQQPFFVLATQNPLEQEGTYPLPEAQLDRFLFKVDVPFPSHEELGEIVARTVLKQPVDVQPVIDGAGILAMRRVLDSVVVAPAVADYAVRLVLSTHPESPFATDGVKHYVRWGASPRAAQALIRAARVRALAKGRPHVAVADIQRFAPDVLRHRVILNYDGQAEEIAVESLLKEIVAQLPEEAG